MPVQRGGPDTCLLGHRLQRGTDALLQEVPLRRFQESRTIALDVRTGLTPLLSLIAHAPACLLRSVGPRKRRLTPHEFESKAEAASGQLVTAAPSTPGQREDRYTWSHGTEEGHLGRGEGKRHRAGVSTPPIDDLRLR
ncbi:hypothetical protein GCM10010244_55440 [Streptomyces coeruleorubidus]|nr:hypothetical protein GCM10010244_55440 [Streptomyces bellus]